jgi:hypothetical protein
LQVKNVIDTLVFFHSCNKLIIVLGSYMTFTAAELVVLWTSYIS